MAMTASTPGGDGFEVYSSFGLKTCPQEDCRICLENVGVQPIFGDDNGKPDISLEIITFGGVQIREDDDFPKFICDQCFSLLENAMSFRKFARRTDALLKRRMKKLTQPTIPKHTPATAIELHSLSSGLEEKPNKSKIEYVHVPSIASMPNISYPKLETYNEVHTHHLPNAGLTHNPNSFQRSFEQQIHHSNDNMVMLLVSQDDHQLTTLHTPIPASSHSMANLTISNSYVNVNSHIPNEVNHTHDIYSQASNYNTATVVLSQNNEILHENNDMSRDSSPISFQNRVEVENKEETGNYYCKYCKENFSSQDDYEAHRSTVQHKRNYVISFLPKKTTKKTNEKGDLSEDKKSARVKNDKCALTKKECNICNKMIDRRSLPRHIKRKHEMDKDTEPKVKLECPICKKVFAKQYYPLHMNRHKESENKKYVCDQCGRKFAFKSSFNTHRLIHTNEFPHKCDYCPYQGRTKGLLKIHMRRHTGDYPFKCTQCDTQCLTKSNLNWHLKRHKGPVDFICGVCNRGFYSKLQLERHISVTHYGEKNHICQFCGSAFGYRNGLMRHLRKVHKRPKLRLSKKSACVADLTRLPPDPVPQQKPMEPPPMPPHPPPSTATYIVQNFVY